MQVALNPRLQAGPANMQHAVIVVYATLVQLIRVGCQIHAILYSMGEEQVYRKSGVNAGK